MPRKVFVVTGLGYGDEGKGKTVHWLSSKYNAHTVVRVGGPQACHRIVSSDGKEHVHAQFGSGTLSGAATHLSKYMVIEPYAILSEGKSLENNLGIAGVFDKLTIHEDALVITPFQAIANRLRELVRGDKRLGSVGVGVGETVLDSESRPEDAIRAKDLANPELKSKLEMIKKRKLYELGDVISRIKNLRGDALQRAEMELENLKSYDTLEWAVGWFAKLASIAKIVDSEYVADKIFGRDGTVVFEGSQGVLLDRWYGFHPYTTKVRTIPETAATLVRECNYDGEVKILGVLRAYHTRHGPGPFVTESANLTEKLPDAANGNHQWQGSFRVGCFDFVAAKYAIDVCGGENIFNWLVITCVDRIANIGEWETCRSYNADVLKNDDEFFIRNKTDSIVEIKIYRNSGDSQLDRQEKLGRLLHNCSPNISKLKTKKHFTGLCANLINEELGIQVIAVSAGPTEKDCVELIKI